MFKTFAMTNVSNEVPGENDESKKKKDYRNSAWFSEKDCRLCDCTKQLPDWQNFGMSELGDEQYQLENYWVRPNV